MGVNFYFIALAKGKEMLESTAYFLKSHRKAIYLEKLTHTNGLEEGPEQELTKAGVWK